MERIFYNGKFYQGRDMFKQAMFAKDGIIEKISTNEEILSLNKNCELIDLQGRTVIPGFNDSHLHLEGVGYRLSNLNLYGLQSIDEVIEKAKKYIIDNKIDDVLLGNGWNQDYFVGEKRLLNRHDLDQISRDIPIMFTRVCGHILVANTKALEILEIDENTLDVEGGKIIREDDGFPNGVFCENAMKLFNKFLNTSTAEQRKKYIKLAIAHAVENGVTSVQTNDVSGDNFEDVLSAYKEIEKEGKLYIRITHQCAFENISAISSFINNFNEREYNTNFNKIGPIKLFADGSLGARTAYLRDEYKDDIGNSGVNIYTDEELDEITKYIDSNNRQMLIHAIGDGAIEQVLNSYEKIINNGNKNRHGIVHLQITDEEIIAKMKKLECLALVQPIFLNYDIHIVEDRVGERLAKTSYAFNTLVKKGVHVSLGTDAPVEDLNPFNNIYCAVNRKDLSGELDKSWNESEKMDIYDAIDAYTKGSAYVSFEESIKGRLEENYYADFAVLDDDIFKIDAERIKDIKTVMTVVGGEIVYRKQ